MVKIKTQKFWTTKIRKIRSLEQQAIKKSVTNAELGVAEHHKVIQRVYETMREAERPLTL